MDSESFNPAFAGEIKDVTLPRKFMKQKKAIVGLLLLVVGVVGIVVGLSTSSEEKLGAVSEEQIETGSDVSLSTLTTNNQNCFVSNTDYHGQDLFDLKVASASGCQRKCQITPQCVFFTYSGKYCYLKSGVTPSNIKSRPGYTSGMKDCGLKDACTQSNKHNCCAEKFPETVNACQEPFGINFVLDASGSIQHQNWDRIKSFTNTLASDLVTCFDITYMATTIYSTKVHFTKSYGPSQLDAFITDVHKYEYKSGGGTNTPSGLEQARDTANGKLDTLGLPFSMNDFFFVLSDGYPNCKSGSNDCKDHSTYYALSTAAAKSIANNLLTDHSNSKLIHVPIGTRSVSDMFKGIDKYSRVINIPKISNWNNLLQAVSSVEDQAKFPFRQCPTDAPTAITTPTKYPTIAPTKSIHIPCGCKTATIHLHCDNQLSFNYQGAVYTEDSWPAAFRKSLDFNSSTEFEFSCKDVGVTGGFIATMDICGYNVSTYMGTDLFQPNSFQFYLKNASFSNGVGYNVDEFIFRRFQDQPWGITDNMLEDDAMMVWDEKIQNTMVFGFNFFNFDSVCTSDAPTSSSPSSGPTTAPTSPSPCVTKWVGGKRVCV